MPNLAELMEEEGEAPSEGASRRSDGAALLLLRERQSVGSGLGAAAGSGSPPHKHQRTGGGGLVTGRPGCGRGQACRSICGSSSLPGA